MKTHMVRRYLIFLHELSGVREGTVIAALITGNIVKIFSKYFSGLSRILVPDDAGTFAAGSQSEN